MTHQEKRAWITLVVSTAACAVYAATILSRAHGHPLPRVPYAAALLWTVGGAILASIVAETALGGPRAMAGWDRFWIANVICLCFFLSAILGSVTKIIAYRKTFPQW